LQANRSPGGGHFIGKPSVWRRWNRRARGGELGRRRLVGDGRCDWGPGRSLELHRQLLRLIVIVFLALGRADDYGHRYSDRALFDEEQRTELCSPRSRTQIPSLEYSWARPSSCTTDHDSEGLVHSSGVLACYGRCVAGVRCLATPNEEVNPGVDTRCDAYYLHARYYDPATAQFFDPGPDVGDDGESLRVRAGRSAKSHGSGRVVRRYDVPCQVAAAAAAQAVASAGQAVTPGQIVARPPSSATLEGS
jgi:hypothetical protein